MPFYLLLLLSVYLNPFFISSPVVRALSLPSLYAVRSPCQRGTVRCGFRRKRTRAVELYRHAVRAKDQEMKLRPRDAPPVPAQGRGLAVTLIKLGKVLLGSSRKAERREAVELFQTALDWSLLSLGPEHTLTREIQPILTAAFRTSRDSRSRPLSHRRSSGSQSSTSNPLYPHAVTERGAAHTPRTPSTGRPLSGCSHNAKAPSEQDQEPVKNQVRSAGLSHTSPRPWSAFQTTVFGPQSDISHLAPRPKTAPGSSSRSAKKSRVPQRSGRCYLAGRNVLDKRTDASLFFRINPSALNREIGSLGFRQRHIPMPRLEGLEMGRHSCKHHVTCPSGGR